MAKFHLEKKIDGEVYANLACNSNPHTRGRVLCLGVFLAQLEATPDGACKKCTQLAYDQHGLQREARKDREDANRKKIRAALEDDCSFLEASHTVGFDTFMIYNRRGVKIMFQFTHNSAEEDSGFTVRSWHSANATDLANETDGIDRVIEAVVTGYKQRQEAKALGARMRSRFATAKVVNA